MGGSQCVISIVQVSHNSDAAEASEQHRAHPSFVDDMWNISSRFYGYCLSFPITVCYSGMKIAKQLPIWGLQSGGARILTIQASARPWQIDFLLRYHSQRTLVNQICLVKLLGAASLLNGCLIVYGFLFNQHKTQHQNFHCVLWFAKQLFTCIYVWLMSKHYCMCCDNFTQSCRKICEHCWTHRIKQPSDGERKSCPLQTG